jgi:hypothetical protein
LFLIVYDFSDGTGRFQITVKGGSKERKKEGREEDRREERGRRREG